MRYDYAVIGAGVSGMSAAIILAQKGYRTVLIEQSAATGPTLRGFTRDGFLFDTGFHYTGGLGDGEPLDRLFHYIGISNKIRKIPFGKDGADLFRCLKPPFEFSFSCGLDNIRKRITLAFPREDRAVSEYFRIICDGYERLPYMNLDREMTSFMVPFTMHEQSLAEVLDRLTSNTMLKAVLSMHCLLHGVPPGEVPITNHGCVVVPYYESAHKIAGGGRRLAEAFDERLHETCVDVYCGRKAEQLLMSGSGHVAGIRLEDGSSIECTGSVVTVHPSHLLEIVPDRTFRPAYRTNLAALEDTSSAIILFGRCREPVESLRHRNIYAFPFAEGGFSTWEGMIEEKPLYITGTGVENDEAPAGYVAICPAPPMKNALGSLDHAQSHTTDHGRFKEEMVRRLLARLESLIPQLKGNILYTECATPNTVAKFTNSPTGSLYGVKHKVGQVNPMPLTKIENLYLAGQAVTAPGILGAMISSCLACGYIVGHETLRKELRKCA